jgi:hypothetical protein
MFECEFCKKEYLTVSSLNRHKKTTKFCINIQKEKSSVICNDSDQILIDVQSVPSISSDINYTCDYCNKTFLRKYVYNKHLNRCTNNDANNKLRLRVEELTNVNKSLNDELILLRTQVELLQKNNKQLINLSKSKVTNVTKCIKNENRASTKNKKNKLVDKIATKLNERMRKGRIF